jgi:hypothetical protein
MSMIRQSCSVGRWGASGSVDIGQVAPVCLVQHLASTRCASLAGCRLGMKADNGAIYRSAASGVVPVLRPVFLDGTAGFTNILEVGATKVLVLLDVQPEVEYIFRAFALEE